MKTLSRLTLLALFSLSAFAQTAPVWVKVATEANTLTSGPITVRYGASSGITTAGVDCSKANCWAVVPLKSANNLSLSDVSCCVFGVADPAPGVAKELDVQEGPAAVVVTISGIAKTVPALPPPPPVTTTYLITVMGTATLTNGAPMPANLPVTVTSVTAVKQ